MALFTKLASRLFACWLTGLVACSPLVNRVDLEPAQKPNIILFLVDDMGTMDSSVPMLTDLNGRPKMFPLNEYYNTPNIKLMADKGIRFSKFYAHSVCSPTRASIITGHNSARHKITTWIDSKGNNSGKFGPPGWRWTGIKPTEAKLPLMLQKLGYETIHVGKGHFAPVGYIGAKPEAIGFTVNVAGSHHGAPGSYYGEDAYGLLKRKKERAVPGLDLFHGKAVYLTKALTLEANKAIEQSVKNDKPFFLYMSHYAVHTPFQEDPRFIKNYQHKALSKTAQTYASMIEGIDSSLGQIQKKLEQLDIANNTLIFFLGDNGSTAPLSSNNQKKFDPYTHSSSAPLRGMKGTSYEGGVRVPFIASWAARDTNHYWQKKLPIKRHAINDQLASVMDILPTIQSLVDAQLPRNYLVDGFDLSVQLTGDFNGSRNQSFLNHFPHVHRSSYFTSYVNGNWKLVYYYPLIENTKDRDPERKHGKNEYRLYNLLDDPYENNNLASIKTKKLDWMLKAMVQELDQKNALYPMYNGKLLRPKLPSL